MNDLDKAQMMAPEGEFLAYINPKEAGILKALGGSGIMTPMGIPSFMDLGPGGLDNPGPSGFGPGPSSGPSSDMSTGFDDTADVNMGLQGGMPAFTSPDSRGGGGDNFIQTIGNLYNRFSPIQNIGRGIRGIGRGIGNLFSRLADLRGFNPDGSRRTQKEYEEARQNRITQNRISNIMGRDAPFTRMTLNNLEGLYENLYGKGNVPSNINNSLIGSTNKTRSGTTDDVYPDRVEGILSQAPDYNFRDAMREINLQPGFNARQNLSAANFIDPSKTISSEDTRDVQNRISDTFGFNSNYIDLAKNYTKEDMEKLGAKDRTILGANDQLDALQEYYDAVQTLSGAGSKFAPNNLSKARDFITSQSAKPMGMGSFGIDMSLVPEDFLQNLQDLQPFKPDGTKNLQQQKSPFSLFNIK